MRRGGFAANTVELKDDVFWRGGGGKQGEGDGGKLGKSNSVSPTCTKKMRSPILVNPETEHTKKYSMMAPRKMKSKGKKGDTATKKESMGLKMMGEFTMKPQDIPQGEFTARSREAKKSDVMRNTESYRYTCVVEMETSVRSARLAG